MTTTDAFNFQAILFFIWVYLVVGAYFTRKKARESLDQAMFLIKDREETAEQLLARISEARAENTELKLLSVVDANIIKKLGAENASLLQRLDNIYGEIPAYDPKESTNENTTSSI